jgi:hypothetical protein
MLSACSCDLPQHELVVPSTAGGGLLCGNVSTEQLDDTGLNGTRLTRGFVLPFLHLPVPDEQLLLRPIRRPVEGHSVTGSDALLPDEASPTLGEHVALAAVPVRVPEPPHLPLAILEVEEHALAGGGGVPLPREVLLGVMLGHDEPVQLADVAGRDNFLKKLLPCPRRRRPRARAHATTQVLVELVGVGVLAQHVHDLGLGVRRQESELAVGSALRGEVEDGFPAAEPARRHVVGARGGVLVGKRAEPHPLVAIVDLRAPAPVWLRHDALEP